MLRRQLPDPSTFLVFVLKWFEVCSVAGYKLKQIPAPSGVGICFCIQGELREVLLLAPISCINGELVRAADFCVGLCTRTDGARLGGIVDVDESKAGPVTLAPFEVVKE